MSSQFLRQDDIFLHVSHGACCLAGGLREYEHTHVGLSVGMCTHPCKGECMGQADR